jgi:hypothetical protein
MKTLNNFFEKAHLFKVWLITYPVLILFISGLVYGLDYLSGENTFTGNFMYLKFGAFMGMVLSWMVILITSMERKSTIFWDYVKIIETLINNVKTKKELEDIWANEYQELIKNCQGGSQIGEVKRIKSIIETRYKYWKD